MSFYPLFGYFKPLKKKKKNLEVFYFFIKIFLCYQFLFNSDFFYY